MLQVGGADEAIRTEIVDVTVWAWDAEVGMGWCFIVDVVDGKAAGKGSGHGWEGGLRGGVWFGLFGGGSFVELVLGFVHVLILLLVFVGGGFFAVGAVCQA